MDQAVLNHKRKVGRDNKARLEFGLNEMGEWIEFALVSPRAGDDGDQSLQILVLILFD
jgi:hypothetical protein